MKIFYISLISLLVFLVACDPPENDDRANENNVESMQMDIPETHKIGEFAVGTQTWTFHRFSVLEAIPKTAATGAKVIELFPGQQFSPDDDTPFDQHASDEMIRQVKDSLDAYDLIPVNFGVVGLTNDEEENRQVFEFAEQLGVQAITSEPHEEAMDLIEELVQEYDIMLAIHNHFKGWDAMAAGYDWLDEDEYLHWDPEYVHSLVEGRDERIGASADIGHFIRSDLDPLEALQTLEGRIISVHFSDVEQFGPEGEDTAAGTGVGDLVGVLDELKRQNFGGNISIEYETNWYDNVPDVAQFIGYIRGWDDTRKAE